MYGVGKLLENWRPCTGCPLLSSPWLLDFTSQLGLFLRLCVNVREYGLTVARCLQPRLIQPLTSEFLLRPTAPPPHHVGPAK